MSSPETVKEWEKFYDSKSLYCHPERRFDSAGRPTSSQSYDFMQPEEYLRKLLSKNTDAFGNPVGLLEICKQELREAKARWKYHCEHSRMIDPKSPPTGDYAKEINRLTGKKKTLEKEARILNGWLGEKNEHESDKLKKQQQKFAFKGLCKLSDGQVCRCDFREVENGKFVDNGESLDAYLVEVRKRKRENALATAAVARKERQQLERDRLNEIQSRKIAVDEQIKKIRRRRSEATA